MYLDTNPENADRAFISKLVAAQEHRIQREEEEALIQSEVDSQNRGYDGGAEGGDSERVGYGDFVITYTAEPLGGCWSAACNYFFSITQLKVVKLKFSIRGDARWEPTILLNEDTGYYVVMLRTSDSSVKLAYGDITIPIFKKCLVSGGGTLVKIPLDIGEENYHHSQLIDSKQTLCYIKDGYIQCLDRRVPLTQFIIRHSDNRTPYRVSQNLLLRPLPSMCAIL